MKTQTNTHLQAWAIAAEDFPADGYASDQLEYLVRYAILAPSSHNAQPWLFRINAMDVELFADRRRALRAVDPYDRELTISCGAALYNMRVAAEYFGHAYQVEVFPDPAEENLLARLRLGLSGETSSDDIVVFHAITQRRTHRQPMRPEPIPGEILDELEAAARKEGVGLQVLTSDEHRNLVADFVAEADRRQWADKAFREELARWVRAKGTDHKDGLPIHDVGISDWLSFAGPALIRTFDRGGGQAAQDREIAVHSPALAVLYTGDDDPRSWLRAGQALQSVLLHARAEEVWASFLNQPIEVPDLREQFTAAMGLAGNAQILLRLGRGTDVPPTPRRSAREVLIMHQTTRGG